MRVYGPIPNLGGVFADRIVSVGPNQYADKHADKHADEYAYFYYCAATHDRSKYVYGRAIPNPDADADYYSDRYID